MVTNIYVVVRWSSTVCMGTKMKHRFHLHAIWFWERYYKKVPDIFLQALQRLVNGHQHQQRTAVVAEYWMLWDLMVLTISDWDFREQEATQCWRKEWRACFECDIGVSIVCFSLSTLRDVKFLWKNITHFFHIRSKSFKHVFISKYMSHWISVYQCYFTFYHNGC